MFVVCAHQRVLQLCLANFACKVADTLPSAAIQLLLKLLSRVIDLPCEVTTDTLVQHTAVQGSVRVWKCITVRTTRQGQCSQLRSTVFVAEFCEIQLYV